jgi:hypothetical protein
MVNFTAFHYARSFACFPKPYPIHYPKAPRYLRISQRGYITSAPFILNYLDKKYRFSYNLNLEQPPLTVQLLVTAYRAIPKPSRRVLVPVTFSNSRSIAAHYYPDTRLVFYKAFFFKRFFFAFFTYRTSQTYAIIASRAFFSN